MLRSPSPCSLLWFGAREPDWRRRLALAVPQVVWAQRWNSTRVQQSHRSGKVDDFELEVTHISRIVLSLARPPAPDDRMKKYTKTALAIAAVLVGLGLTYSRFQRPMRTTQAFVGHLYHERYEEAALMLRAPSALEVASDGGLILVDNEGNLKTVLAAKLPFIASAGSDGGPDHDFQMTALGSSTNGVLDTPAVVLYLSIDAGKVRIQSVGPW